MAVAAASEPQRPGQLAQQPSQQPMRVSVLAVTSLQVLLLVVVGTTGFVLSIVSNFVPQRFRSAPPPQKGRSFSPSLRRRLPSPSTSTSRSASESSQAHPALAKRDSSPSVPELLPSSLESSDDDASIQTSDHPLLESVSERQQVPTASKVVQIHPPTQSGRSASACQQSRRTSLDIVRHTLHIPPRSPPTSKPSSLASTDGNDKSHCPRPKIPRLFSSSSREPSPPHSEAEGSDHGLVKPAHPERRMSMKLGSGFRSKGRRALSQVESAGFASLALTAETTTSAGAFSPPTSPTSTSGQTKHLSNLRSFFGSPEGKPKNRRSASEHHMSAVASPPRAPLMDRHQLMAAARKEREREASLYAAAHADLASGATTPLDMSGKSELSMQEHFA